jgi:hypothetical protein
MNATLTDRYVEATARGVDDAQRAEVERELRATIEDMIDGRLAAGAVRREEAERAVLVELGDPMRLAASYSGRPLHLIGPAVYPDWLRLLKLLLALVVPLAMVASLVARAFTGGLAGDTIGSTMASTVLTGLTTAAHLVFWVTLSFAVVERSAAGRATGVVTWDPDQLPDTSRKVGLGESIASIAVLALFATALVWQQVASPVVSDGSAIPVLDPALWSSWLPWFIAVIVLEMAFAVWLYRAREWTWRHAAANVALNLAFAVPAIVLLQSGRLFNPEFIATMVEGGWADAESHLVAVTTVGIAVVSVWDAVDGLLKARRHTVAAAPARI